MFSDLVKNISQVDRVKDLFFSDSLEYDNPNYPYHPPVYIDPTERTTPSGSGSWFFDNYGGDNRYFKYSGYSSALHAYCHCPPVSAIINRKAQCFINGKTYVMNTKDKEAQGPIASKINNLFINPNPIQSQKDFLSQMYIYMQVFGFSILLPILPFGYTEKVDAVSMWNIPPSWIDVQLTEENFTRNGGVALTQIVVNFNGHKITLNLSDLIIIRDFTPSFTSITFPDSRLKAVALPINNIIGSFESRNVLINFRGALGILTKDAGKGQYTSSAISEDEKLALQNDFRRYGLRAKQFQIILTTASLKWQQMGYATKDLMLMEEVEESTLSICANLNFPPFILGLADTTYNNMNNAEKGLYENSVIPDAENVFEQLTRGFGLSDYNLTIIKDFNHISVLQEDKESRARGRNFLDQAMKIEFDNGLITINDWRISLDEDPLPAELGDVRVNDIKNANTPLATIIGVGGVQGIIEVITSAISPEAKKATLEIVFGLKPVDAQRMCVANDEPAETTIQPEAEQSAEAA